MLNRVAWSSRSRRGGQLHGKRHQDYRKHCSLRKEYSPFYRGEGPGCLLLTVRRQRNIGVKSTVNITIVSTNATQLLPKFPTTLICLPHREPSLSTSQHARQRQWDLHGEKATSDSAGHEGSHEVLQQDSRVLIPNPRKRIKMLRTPFFAGKQKNRQLCRDGGCPTRAHFWSWWKHESTRALCQPLSLGAAPT